MKTFKQTAGRDLTGRVVAITGGARGIGRSTAEAFLAAGARVAMGDLDAELCARTAEELGAGGGLAVGLPLDVTSPESFEAFFDRAEEHLGPIDVLVNNAGVMPTGEFLDEDAATTRLILGVNVEGVLNGSRCATRRFVSRRRGHIVNIASLAGVGSFAGLATYCGSKHFVMGFSGALERELGVHDIAVTVVLPGIVRTELSVGANMNRALENVLAVTPEQVARAIVRAVDRRSSHVTVPRRFGALVSVNSVLPHRVQLAFERVTGADRAYSQADATAREGYHERLRSQSGLRG